MVVARRADEIVDIAARLFYERGYQSVSTRSLAQAAGIQGGSLYHHFVELQAVRRDFQQRVQRFLAAGVAAGDFAVPDPKLAGIAVLDLLKGVDAWMREPGRLSRRQVAETYSVLVLQLMGAAAP